MRPTDWRIAGPWKKLHTRTYFLNQSRSDLPCPPLQRSLSLQNPVFDCLTPGFGPFGALPALDSPGNGPRMRIAAPRGPKPIFLEGWLR